MRRVMFAFALAGLAAPLLAQSAPPPRGPGPKLEVALSLAQAAIAACRATGDHVAALVVDSDNTPVVLLADEGSVVLAQQFAPRKTALALKYQAPSAATAARAKSDAALTAEIKADPKIGFALPGAYPVIVAGKIVGALAVSGGSSPEKDDSCANDAIARAGGTPR